MNRSIDLNCDMGEGLDNDALLMPFISSANIACGYHAGNEDTMKRTLELAIENNVAIGAHPGFLDPKNFGRRELQISLPALFDLVTAQLHQLQQVAKTFNATMHHVKPHGALYNMAARDRSLSRTIASAVRAFDPNLILYGLSGSHLISEAEAIYLKTASEVFADRTYQQNGSLTPRSMPGAMIDNAEDSLKQVIQMLTTHTLTAINTHPIPIKADTICIHGDGPHAVEFAEKIRKGLIHHHFTIQTI